MIIETRLGPVYAAPAGTSDAGKTVLEIHSVPYARAARFERPVPIERYPSGRPLNREETVCFPQHGYPLWLNRFLKHHMMRPEFLPLRDRQTADAFVVNIWTDDLEGRKPVTVFIHGGGEGSGTVPLYTGGNLAKKGLVAVTITYRVGCFGYMPTRDERGAVTASLSYLDQQAALLWVRKNIAAFGGDPENITLIGHCGGGVAALYHLLNPISSRCFDRLMLLCGNLPMLTPPDEAEKIYTKALACYHARGLADLRALPARRLAARRAPGMADIIDGVFFTRDPAELLRGHKFPPKPILLGTNADEFSMIELPMYYKAMDIASRADRLDAALSKKYGDLAGRLKEAFEAEASGPADLQVKIMEFLVFHHAAWYLLKQFKDICPVFAYRLNFVPDLYGGLRGSYHGAELAYFFDNFDKMGIPLTEKNRRETAILQKDWLAFVREGDIPGRPRFDKSSLITSYDREVTAIPFPKAELLDELEGSGIFERTWREYLSQGR